VGIEVFKVEHQCKLNT